MRHGVGRKGREDGSSREPERAITLGLPGNAARSVGLVGLTVCLLLLSYGCSAKGRSVVLRSSESHSGYSSVLVTQDGSDPSVPPEVSRDFRNALTTYLYEHSSFVHGPELRIVYRITGYPSAGEEIASGERNESGIGSVTAEVTFYNFVEKEIASIRAEGDARDADHIDKAVKECARQVALYVNRNFQ